MSLVKKHSFLTTHFNKKSFRGKRIVYISSNKCVDIFSYFCLCGPHLHSLLLREHVEC